ncbi:E3 ubiquitin-protein ligase [Musa troglodytarum]|uniref:RING-type E3 ubiquitin transferase n=1 Tax=Musa troglodytarum TaxID=320322 RepID=A0A9E7HK80_9LILI|nr:E3 ubiquitin-protein ligase [Musa troglodytarum]
MKNKHDTCDLVCLWEVKTANQEITMTGICGLSFARECHGTMGYQELNLKVDLPLLIIPAKLFTLYVAPNFMCMIDVAVLVLFMILNSHQMSPNFLLWLVLGVFLMATSLRMYATCQQLQAQAQAHAAAASGFLGGTELRLHVPPSIAFATRGRLQSLRLQLALLDREFDDLDYDALRALDSDNPPDAPSMTEEEINSLPVHKYKLQSSSRQRQDPILYLYIVVDQCCNMHRLLQYLQLR